MDHAALNWEPPPRKVRRLRWSAMQEAMSEGSNHLEMPEAVCFQSVAGLMYRVKLLFRSGNCAVTSTKAKRVAAVKGHELWPRGDTAQPNGVEGWRVPTCLFLQVVIG